ncbi:MAG: SDR family NAD(P)-dependent oxidoreductase [Pseudomonadota bacterium]
METQSLPFNALVIGASGGIGAAVVEALENSPRCAGVRTLSRSHDRFDITDETAIAAAADTLAADGAVFDLIFDATGVLVSDGERPEKAFSELNPAAMAAAFAVNAAGPALLMKHLAPLLSKDRKSVFATLSARVGSIGDNRLGGWMSYRASKAALNQLVRCAAVEFARKNPNAVIVALHPGTIETSLTRAFAKGRYTATPAEAARNMLAVLDSLTPAESGGFFDYAGKEIPW